MKRYPNFNDRQHHQNAVFWTLLVLLSLGSALLFNQEIAEFIAKL